MLGKFFALLLYLVLSAVHMVVIFVCVYGCIILSTLSVITFFAGILTIILMYMQPELGYNWESVIPCFVFSFVFMFLPLIGVGLSVKLECMRDGLLDFILD